MSFADYAINENRFRVLKQRNPERADKLMQQAQKEIDNRVSFYKQLAAMNIAY
jgi:pyruvate-ferredoxin/flavodoxin oxidoreductase